MAGDTLVTMALADSLFFSIRPGAARGKVILYLLLTMAPFAVVGPLLGPVLDRSRTGRRTVVILSAASRALVCLSMAYHLNGLLLFPEAFAVLVLSKTYLITKSALGAVGGRATRTSWSTPTRAWPCSGSWPASRSRHPASLRAEAAVPRRGLGAAAGGAGVRVLRRWPRSGCVACPTTCRLPVADEREQLRTAGIRLAASAMAVLRGIVGFLTFLVTFGFRQSAGVPAFWFGVVLAASLSGTFVGNLLAPRLRRLVPEERMLMGALLVVAFVGLVAARFGTRPAVAVLAGTVGVAAAAAKVAFDSIVQRDAPDAARGQTFARFETRFQLMWVLGAAVPVFITPLTRHIDLGMGVLAFAAAFAAFSYAVGRKAVAPTAPDEPAGTAECADYSSGSSMRASQRPGASTSAGVGSSRGETQRRARRLVAGALDHAADERGAAVVLRLAQLQPEEALDEPVAVGRLDPPPAHGFAEHPVRSDQRAADRVHDVVDEALEHHRQRLDAGEQLLLRRRLQRAEQHLGVGERRLHALGVGGVEPAHHPFERARVDLEGRHVVGDQSFEPGADVGPAEHGMMGDLVQADPEPEVVGRQAPLLGERVEVGRHDEQLVGRRAGDRQVVLAEGAPAEVPEHRARLQPEQHRADHAPEVAEQLVGADVVGVVGVVARGVERRRRRH